MEFVDKKIYGDVTGKIRTFAILTADNPMRCEEEAKSYTTKEEIARENNKLRESIKSTLKAGSFQYVISEGKYQDKEQSYFIFNITLDYAKHLASIYRQESFIFGKQVDRDKAEIWYYQTDRGSFINSGKRTKDNKWSYDTNKLNYNQRTISNGVNLLTTAEDMFTRKRGFKFSFDFDFDKMEFIPSSDQPSFESSLDETNYEKSRYYSRKRCQR